MQELTVDEISIVSGGCSDEAAALGAAGGIVAYKATATAAPVATGALFAASATAMGAPEAAGIFYDWGVAVGNTIRVAMNESYVAQTMAASLGTYVACKIDDMFHHDS